LGLGEIVSAPWHHHRATAPPRITQNHPTKDQHRAKRFVKNNRTNDEGAKHPKGYKKARDGALCYSVQHHQQQQSRQLSINLAAFCSKNFKTALSLSETIHLHSPSAI